MSIYATWLSIDDENHPPECARWRMVKPDDPAARMFGGDREAWAPTDEPCTCDEKAPIIYQGSHVSPDESDPRGGYLLACAIPNHCHPSVRHGSGADDGPPVEFLRLSVGEHHTTYHGMEKGSATLVLDRRQVTELRDTLTSWLDADDRA